MDKPKLIFIYNAKSGAIASLGDSLKKSFSPSSYQCNLCMVTYGPLKMKAEWKKYLDTLPYEKVFLHKDELGKQFPQVKTTDLPIILLQNGHDTKTIMDKEAINKAKDIKQLQQMFTEALE